jgi:transposase
VPGKRIAAIVGCAEPTVVTWRGRYAEDGLAGLADLPRPGKPAQLPQALRDRVLELTLTEPPGRFGATHWSSRLLAGALAGEGTPISHATVARIWHRFGVQPWRARTFKFSTDPTLEVKIRDVVGLYLHPPTKAAVLCVDEKPQIQALARTAPTLSVRPGHPAAASFDYLRHGTTTLFAALDVATGKVTETCTDRHRHREFLPSSSESPPPIRAASCMWWSTTCPPTRTRRCAPGWSGIRGCSCTSPRRRGPG